MSSSVLTLHIQYIWYIYINSMLTLTIIFPWLVFESVDQFLKSNFSSVTSKTYIQTDKTGFQDLVILTSYLHLRYILLIINKHELNNKNEIYWNSSNWNKTSFWYTFFLLRWYFFNKYEYWSLKTWHS